MTVTLGAAPAQAAEPPTAPAQAPSSPAPSSAAPSSPAPFDPPLYDKTSGGGTVRVNVVTGNRTDLAGAATAGRTLQSFDTLPVVTLKVDRSGLDTLAAQPGVVSVTEDIPVPPALDQSVPLIGGGTAHAAGRTGTGSAVAILDTGVAAGHPFLAGRVVAEACFSQNDPDYSASSLCPDGTERQEGPGAADPSTAACAAIAACDHGTHVAGVVAGQGTGVAGAPASGVAPGADIIAMQVFSRFTSETRCGLGAAPCVLSFTSSQLAALEKVLQLRQSGTPVVAANLSLGSGQYTTACDGDPRKQAIDNLLTAGVATVVAAGNNGYGAAVNAPACISSAVAVGSTTIGDELSSFSNRGQLLDVLAPGSGIVSSVPGGGYAAKDGTSMAAPHVAGALAVLRQAHPGRSTAYLQSLLKTTGKPLAYPGAETSRIDIGKALGRTPAGDFDGDGRSDIATWYDYADGQDGVHLWSGGADGRLQAPAPAYTAAAGTWDASRTKLVTGDFNGDRRGDIGLFYGYASGEVKLFTKLGKGDGTFAPASVSWTATDWTFAYMNPRTGDFNGDGRSDIAVWYDYADGSDKVFTFLARPDGDFAHPFSSWHRDTGWTFANMKLTSGDHNGDGRDDLAAMYFYSTGEVKVFTFPALATGGFDNAQITGYTSTTWGSKERTSTVSGDFDGDGRDEVAAWYDYADGTDAVITFSPDAQGALGGRTVAWQTAAGHYTRDNLTLTSGDFNGDGRDDLACLYGYSDGSIKMITWPAKPTGTFHEPLHGAGKATGWNYGHMRVFTP